MLVTEWVEGTRLDRDASPDVPRLCGVALNAYLTMLLDTGCLHCDPHPGNLLRTTDGKLCILDWGMTLGVPSGLQYGLLEFIAHINTEDYDAIPQDFVNLGFAPEGVTPEKLASSGTTDGPNPDPDPDPDPDRDRDRDRDRDPDRDPDPDPRWRFWTNITC